MHIGCAPRACTFVGASACDEFWDLMGSMPWPRVDHEKGSK